MLAEREPHAAIYDALETILDSLDDPRVAAPMIARFELDFLAELGFGLDLSSCAATGATDDLIYVSPKSGRAVSRAAGEAYRDRLLRLPAFLRSDAEPETADDLADAFALTGFFLDRHAFAPRGLALPEARAPFRHGAGARDPLRAGVEPRLGMAAAGFAAIGIEPACPVIAVRAGRIAPVVIPVLNPMGERSGGPETAVRVAGAADAANVQKQRAKAVAILAAVVLRIVTSVPFGSALL